jgi:hypothetical protein
MTPQVQSGCSFSQAMVDQTPKFDNQVRKRKRKQHGNQVISKAGIIRGDKRHKTRYL